MYPRYYCLLLFSLWIASNVTAQKHSSPHREMKLEIMGVFPPAGEAKRYNEGTLMRIVYYRDSTMIHVYTNKLGQVVKVSRYYTDVHELPLYIVAKLVERFPEYTPISVIEEQDVYGVNYQINISKETAWLQLHSDGNGRFTIINRYTHATTPGAGGHLSTLP
jgi:hypothetical protein